MASLPFRRLNGWHRIVMALCAAWSIGCFVYFPIAWLDKQTAEINQFADHKRDFCREDLKKDRSE